MTGTSFARWLALGCLLGASGPVAAQDDEADGLGVTVTVIEDAEAAHERELVHEIELPEVAPEPGGPLAAERDDEARRPVDRESAHEARELGSERGRRQPHDRP